MVEKFDWTASEMPGKFEAKFGDNCGTGRERLIRTQLIRSST